MKILLFSDFHISGRNPRSRIDNYYQSCLQKFEEILFLSKDCDYIISAGDLLDSPVVANTIVDDLLDRIDKNKKDFFVIFGNHELQNYNLEASKATSLAHMIRRSKYVKHLNELEDKNCYIKGYDCFFENEYKLKEEGLFHNSKKENTIAILHQFVTIKSFIQSVAHVVAKDIMNNYSLIVNSHYHIQFDEIINKCRFLNLGSIGRTAINEQHSPQVAIIDTDTLKIEKIQLKSAKKIEEIFDLEKYHELKDSEKSIEDFIASLNSATWQANDLNSQIEIIGKEQKVEKTVIKYIQDKIKEINNV